MTTTIIGGSVIGDSHIRHGIECQDSYLIIDGKHKNERKSHFYNELPQGVKLVAVADGHGSSSCPYSKTGSQIAANVFCDIMTEFAVKYKNHMDDLFRFLNREGDITRLAKSIVHEWERRVNLVHCNFKDREIPKREDGTDDYDAIWKQYGSTLLGLMITDQFVFAFQLGDGDITYVDHDKAIPLIEGEKILGVETHSISKADSWNRVLTRVIDVTQLDPRPYMIVLSTDGWMNSHVSDAEFYKTCRSYANLLYEYGPNVIEENLTNWLSETSRLGCGDDITAVFAYVEY